MSNEIMSDNLSSVDLREMATASTLFDVADMLIKAFESRNFSVEDLATKLGVTPERIRQVIPLGDDDNLMGDIRVSTFARYMFELGYTIDFRAVKVADGADATIVNKKPARRQRRASAPVSEPTLQGNLYELLLSVEGDKGFPLVALIDTLKHDGYRSQETMEFIGQELVTGRLKMCDDMAIVCIR